MAPPSGTSPEHLRIMCPNLTCRRVLAVPAASRGKNVRCKGCGSTIRIPDRAPPKPAMKKPDQGAESAAKAA